MSPRCCPYCGQALPEHRLGIEFTRMEGRIFDLVVNAGAGGISNSDLYDIVCSGRPSLRHTLNVHIYNINERLAPTGYQIKGRDMRVLKKAQRTRPQDAISPQTQRALGL